MNFKYKPSTGPAVSALFTIKLNECRPLLDLQMKKYSHPAFFYDHGLSAEQVKAVVELFPQHKLNPIAVATDKKDIKKVEQIWNQLVDEVHDVAIVLGGGTLSDLTGFACSTYQRGVPRIVFPTTLLAMVDATIGGKTGVDYQDVKNAIGTMHYPILSISYLPFLDTLSDSELTSGFSEIIKVAVLQNPELFRRLTRLKNCRDICPELLCLSAKQKAKICEEGSSQKIKLLYGHAIGHALEKCTETKLRHGDAVAIGMNIEGAIACIMGIWNQKEWNMQRQLLQQLSLPTKIPPSVTINMVLEK